PSAAGSSVLAQRAGREPGGLAGVHAVDGLPGLPLEASSNHQPGERSQRPAQLALDARVRIAGLRDADPSAGVASPAREGLRALPGRDRGHGRSPGGAGPVGPSGLPRAGLAVAHGRRDAPAKHPDRHRAPRPARRPVSGYLATGLADLVEPLAAPLRPPPRASPAARPALARVASVPRRAGRTPS